MGQGGSMRQAGAIGRDESAIARGPGSRKHGPSNRPRRNVWPSVPRISGTTVTLTRHERGQEVTLPGGPPMRATAGW